MTDSHLTDQPGASSQDASSTAKPGVGGLIVVGVDGSTGGREALRFAMAEARLRGAELQAVSAWRYPYSYGESLVIVSDDDLKAAAERGLIEAIAAAGEQVGVQVEPVVRQGRAASVLLESAADADMLVVGSRGRGGFAGLLLGSVSQKCVQHAPCPVVVVPAPNPGADNSPQTTGRAH